MLFGVSCLLGHMIPAAFDKRGLQLLVTEAWYCIFVLVFSLNYQLFWI